MAWSVRFTRGTGAAYAPPAPRVRVRSRLTLEQKTNPERLTRFQRGTLLKRVSDFFRITIAAQPREHFFRLISNP